VAARAKEDLNKKPPAVGILRAAVRRPLSTARTPVDFPLDNREQIGLEFRFSDFGHSVQPSVSVAVPTMLHASLVAELCMADHGESTGGEQAA
jgi:hypothetical protein